MPSARHRLQRVRDSQSPRARANACTSASGFMSLTSPACKKRRWVCRGNGTLQDSLPLSRKQAVIPVGRRGPSDDDKADLWVCYRMASCSVKSPGRARSLQSPCAIFRQHGEIRPTARNRPDCVLLCRVGASRPILRSMPCGFPMRTSLVTGRATGLPAQPKSLSPRAWHGDPDLPCWFKSRHAIRKVT